MTKINGLTARNFSPAAALKMPHYPSGPREAATLKALWDDVTVSSSTITL
jgi:hypothetical protein